MKFYQCFETKASQNGRKAPILFVKRKAAHRAAFLLAI